MALLDPRHPCTSITDCEFATTHNRHAGKICTSLKPLEITALTTSYFHGERRTPTTAMTMVLTQDPVVTKRGKRSNPSNIASDLDGGNGGSNCLW